MLQIRLDDRKVNVIFSQVFDIRYGSTGYIDCATDAVFAKVFTGELANDSTNGVIEAANPTGRDRHRSLFLLRADFTDKSYDAYKDGCHCHANRVLTTRNNRFTFSE